MRASKASKHNPEFLDIGNCDICVLGQGGVEFVKVPIAHTMLIYGAVLNTKSYDAKFSDTSF